MKAMRLVDKISHIIVNPIHLNQNTSKTLEKY